MPAAGPSRNCTACFRLAVAGRGAAGHAAVAWPSCSPFHPAGHPFPAARNYTQHNPFRANYDHNHRSVFLMTQRIQRRPLMALFDGADANASTGQRRLNVPTQALYFLNNDFLHQQAAALAKRLAKRTAEPSGRIREAHQLALGRPATGGGRTGP